MPSEIIISDLHQRHAWVDGYLAKRKHDRAIFLGDYFDNFDDSPEEAVETAKWLKSHLDDEDRVFLIGNHDLHYMFPENEKYRGSGFTQEKADAINAVLTPADWAKLQPFVVSQGFWLSHAGVGQSGKVSNPPNPTKLAKRIATDLRLASKNIGRKDLFALVWRKWRNFVPVRHVNQIVGHSPNDFVRSLYLMGDKRETEKDWTPDLFGQIEVGYGNDGHWVGTFNADIPLYQASVNWCIDTDNRHIGILKNGKFKAINNTAKLPPRRTPPPAPVDYRWILSMEAMLR